MDSSHNLFIYQMHIEEEAIDERMSVEQQLDYTVEKKTRKQKSEVFQCFGKVSSHKSNGILDPIFISV